MNVATGMEANLNPVMDMSVPSVVPPLAVTPAASFEEAVSRDEWDGFIEACGSDFCFTFEWCRAWWSHYGRGRRLCILMFRSEGRLVGLMPMFTDRAGVPGARLKLAKFVGSDSTITVLRPAIAEGWHERVAAATITHLVDAEGCDAVWFGPLSGEPGCAEPLRTACGSHPLVDLVRDASPGVHTVFYVPDRFESYMQGLEKRHRDNYKRPFKQLQTRYQLTHSVVDDPGAVLPAFDEFVELHGRQWAAVNNLGHFGDWPRSAEFMREVIRAVAPQGRACFAHIEADGHVITRMHIFRFGKHLHWRLPAREIGAEWDKLSLGNIALVQMLEFAAKQGLTRVEAGPGHYEQKSRYGATEFRLGSLLVVRRGWWPRLKVKALCAWADALHLLYYRIWRLRIAPRLPFRQRPLWRSWMRTRI